MTKRKKEHHITGGKDKLKLISSAGGFSNMTYRDCKRRAVALGIAQS